MYASILPSRRKWYYTIARRRRRMRPLCRKVKSEIMRCTCCNFLLLKSIKCMDVDGVIITRRYHEEIKWEKLSFVFSLLRYIRITSLSLCKCTNYEHELESTCRRTLCVKKFFEDVSPAMHSPFAFHIFHKVHTSCRILHFILLWSERRNGKSSPELWENVKGDDDEYALGLPFRTPFPVRWLST